MGKVLKVLGVVFLVLVLGFVGILIWSHQKGEATQEKFFRAVLSGEPQQVLDMLHPDLRRQVDEPVLASWMAAVKEHLGAFEGLAKDNFSTSSRTENGVSILESDGKVEFARGTAASKLRFVDDQVVAFHIESEALPRPWFTGLGDVAFYDRKARAFLDAIATADASTALASMHENLRAKFEEHAFGKSLQALRARLGLVSRVELLSDEFAVGPPQTLELRYELSGSAETLKARVRFVFDKMQGHLAAFQVPER